MDFAEGIQTNFYFQEKQICVKIFVLSPNEKDVPSGNSKKSDLLPLFQLFLMYPLIFFIKGEIVQKFRYCAF